MTLREFLDGLARGGVTEFAGKVGVSTVYLQQIAARQDGREPSPELSVRIERESGSDVRRWDVRPTDWWLIWPELIGADGAPAVPVPEPAERAA